MIIVSVFLQSAIHESRSKELVKLHISNVGGTKTRGNYMVQVVHPSGAKGLHEVGERCESA